MIKLINRVIIGNLIIGYLLAHFTPISISGKINELNSSERLIIFWGILTLISMLFLWGYAFYHWKKNIFPNNFIKTLWFLVILIGGFLYFVGPLIYYLAVVEFKVSLKRLTS